MLKISIAVKKGGLMTEQANYSPFDVDHNLCIGNVWSKLKNTTFFDLLIHNVVTSREHWAVLLKIDRNTIRNWEHNIIKQIPCLYNDYFQDNPRSSNIDHYQRFLIALITCIKEYEGFKKGSDKTVVSLLRKNSKDVRRSVFEEMLKYV